MTSGMGQTHPTTSNLGTEPQSHDIKHQFAFPCQGVSDLGRFLHGPSRGVLGGGNRPLLKFPANGVIAGSPSNTDIPSRIEPPPIPGIVVGYEERPSDSPSPWSRSSADELASARLRTS